MSLRDAPVRARDLGNGNWTKVMLASKAQGRFACMLRTARRSLVALFVTAGLAAASEPTPVGVWLHSNGRIQMEIYGCGEDLCGRLVWFKCPNNEDGTPRTDVNNPDPALRARPLLGLQVLHGLRRTDEGFWDDGTVYNPDDGETYATQMSIEPDGTLRTRGYILISLIGKTVIWTRVK
jgi:uncharacterized protein (DUF2147 family)